MTFRNPIKLEHERTFSKLVMSSKMNRYFGLCNGLHVKGYESVNQCPLEIKLQRMYMLNILRGNNASVWDEFNKNHPPEMFRVKGKIKTRKGWKLQGEIDLDWYRDQLAKKLRLLNRRKRTRDEIKRDLIMKLF